MRAIPLLLLLCSCGPAMGRINQGAQFPVSRVDPAAFHAAPGRVVLGDYDFGTHAIRLRSTYAEPYTLAHEVRHHADHAGISYADAIRAFTPPDPSPEFARLLATCWEIERAGGSWQAIKDKWGSEAVGHPEILAGLK